ncbi:hypothetical protein Ae201684_014539 [Aphanomyces euteiches]|uniref:HTH CENPB-type domain-containing protein n=1 Tax=Aphanomyces euteiches TaxID=100861 RepID=A0A6G0WJL4_9STRA|nr:hypothetical protein Ae201684_014539 [Aphanomyces euteiches]
MTNAQKARVAEHAKDNPKKTLQELGVWAFHSMQLPSIPSAPAIHRALKQVLDRNRPELKMRKRVTSERLEMDLLEWLEDCETYGIKITYDAIKEYAAEISAMYEDRVNLTFSQGWVCSLLARHKIVDETAIEEGRKGVQEMTMLYEASEVYNFDETAYFYGKGHTSTISKKSAKGRKDVKNRITLAAAVNADGTDKRELKFIGHSARPRWFGNRSTEEMQLDYSRSKKGWMTSTLFREWLERFNSSMAVQDRKVLLLVDNASSHRAIESLSNVEVRFLPPNTTAYLQPLDAGIIAALKKKIQRRKTKMVLSKFEKLRRQHKAAGTKPSRREIIEIHKVDMETGVNWAKEAWEEISMSTVSIYWKHTNIVGNTMEELSTSFQHLHIDAMSIHFVM